MFKILVFLVSLVVSASAFAENNIEKITNTDGSCSARESRFEEKAFDCKRMTAARFTNNNMALAFGGTRGVIIFVGSLDEAEESKNEKNRSLLKIPVRQFYPADASATNRHFDTVTPPNELKNIGSFCLLGDSLVGCVAFYKEDGVVRMVYVTFHPEK